MKKDSKCVASITLLVMFILLFFVIPSMIFAASSSTVSHAKTYTNSIGMEFVLIPAGSFMMGADKNLHKVNITEAFYMGKYEVTQQQWVAVMGSNPSKFKGRTNPVETVSWDDAQRFIRKLNSKEDKKYRLPTEAEWEYACRAGSSTAYYYGDDKNRLSQYAWYDGNSGEQTRPGGQLKPNAWGLYDMYGNVWEWVQDWYDDKYYSKSPSINPTGPSTGSARIMRGGSWYDGAENCRSALRLVGSPGFRHFVYGFRLVLSPCQ